jgi:cupin fold WbuC family metalloprotein
MIKYFSKIEPDKLLHVIVKKSDIKSGRTDVIPEENYIQCALLNLKKNTTFKPHKHIWKKRSSTVIAQESWVVINGSVKCIFYDLDDKILATPILREGDASFTLQGGHTYEILDDNTLVYEMKTGPYEGQEMDKVFI